ncbi:hypothetical protein ABT039_25850 [Streptomyces lasiicapitis]|uniref:hypothetical protein n=1 Tax=Streptomyces lasiicapitis TaxID=1923961 RepID=UPI00331F9E4F
MLRRAVGDLHGDRVPRSSQYVAQAYYERRLAEGKTRREIIRCLKRYVAGEIYPLITINRQSA